MKTFSEIRGSLKESANLTISDPPTVILMRRKAIRVYPNGQRIALYHNERLGLDVSVPYYPGNVGGQGHEVALATVRESIARLDETIIKKLEVIRKNNSVGDVVFANGASVQVQPAVAERILDLYNNEDLKFKTRVDLTRFVSTSPKEFKKVVDFTTQN
jgi:hypothetical protein